MKGYSMADQVADQIDFLNDMNASLEKEAADETDKVQKFREQKALLTRAQSGDRQAKREVFKLLKPAIKAMGYKATRFQAPNAALTEEHIRLQGQDFVKEFIQMNDYDPEKGASMKTAFESRYSNRIDNMITEAPQQTYMDRNLRANVYKFRQQLSDYDNANNGNGSRKVKDMMKSPHFSGMTENELRKLNRLNTTNFVADAEVETEDGPLVFKDQFAPQSDMMDVGKLKQNDFRVQQLLNTFDPESKRIIQAYLDTGAKDLAAIRSGLPISKVKTVLAKWQDSLRAQGLSL